MGKILVMLALVLAISNAYCFEHCLLQASDNLPPCHSSRAGNVSHWVEQHSLKIAPAPAESFATVVVGPASFQPALAIPDAAARDDASPSHGIARPDLPPLRI